MAEITQSQTTAELLKKVGAKLDLSITSSSTPSREQVIVWLNDAALLLARFLPDHRLSSLKVTVNAEDISEYYTVSDELERAVTVKKFGVVCTRLKQRQMDLITTRSPLIYTSRNPAYCNSGNAGSVQLQFWPTSPGPVSVKAIRKPQAYEDDDGWVPGTYALPAELELLAVDYAVLQGKIQDEEFEQAQLLIQKWGQDAGIEGSIDGLGVS